jgi:hypothetical protein
MISFKEYLNEANNCPEGKKYCNKCQMCVEKTCAEKALKEDAVANKKQQLQRRQLQLNRQKLQLQMKAVQKKDQSQDMHMKEGAWQRKEGKNKTGGLNEKGRKSYERENPGSDLKAPQPEGGPRKRSFCARMGGVKGPMKKPNGEPTRKALALRKWKC